MRPMSKCNLIFKAFRMSIIKSGLWLLAKDICFICSSFYVISVVLSALTITVPQLRQSNEIEVVLELYGICLFKSIDLDYGSIYSMHMRFVLASISYKKC